MTINMKTATKKQIYTIARGIKNRKACRPCTRNISKLTKLQLKKYIRKNKNTRKNPVRQLGPPRNQGQPPIMQIGGTKGQISTAKALNNVAQKARQGSYDRVRARNNPNFWKDIRVANRMRNRPY